MYILDTNIIIDCFRGSKLTIDKLGQLNKAELAITTLTLGELYKGAFLSSRKEENILLVASLIRNLEIFAQNVESCSVFGEDYALLKRRGLIPQEIDLMIASICKVKKAVLLTKNINDFKHVPNLKVEEFVV